MQKSNWEKQMDDALADIVSINSALESNRRMVQFKAMFRVLELGLYDDKTISVLVQLSKRIEKDTDQIMGSYMIGHFGMATLYEIGCERSLTAFDIIYNKLDPDNRKLVDALIDAKALRQEQ